jgi:hypothetical protein
VNTTLATPDPYGAICPAIDDDDVGVWYSFRGNDKIVTLEITSTTASDPKIAVLAGSCDDLNCVVSEAGRSLSWEGLRGTDYQILVSGSRAVTIFNIKVRCAFVICQKINSSLSISHLSVYPILF